MCLMILPTRGGSVMNATSKGTYKEEEKYVFNTVESLIGLFI